MYIITERVQDEPSRADPKAGICRKHTGVYDLWSPGGERIISGRSLTSLRKLQAKFNTSYALDGVI